MAYKAKNAQLSKKKAYKEKAFKLILSKFAQNKT